MAPRPGQRRQDRLFDSSIRTPPPDTIFPEFAPIVHRFPRQQPEIPLIDDVVNQTEKLVSEFLTSFQKWLSAGCSLPVPTPTRRPVICAGSKGLNRAARIKREGGMRALPEPAPRQHLSLKAHSSRLSVKSAVHWATFSKPAGRDATWEYPQRCS